MKYKVKIAITDYGVGNLHSIASAFNFFGAEVIISEDSEVLENADGIILPGVGSFVAGMRGLKKRGLIKGIQKIAKSNKPILGICLGAQLMLTEGHEFGISKGLDIIKGKVIRFPVLINNEKIPHIGWNTISPYKNNSWSGGILNSFKSNNQFYFVHSYILVPESKTNILALTSYGEYTYCSVMKKGNIYGCQFHPEKSGKVGLELINNFINLAKSNKF